MQALFNSIIYNFNNAMYFKMPILTAKNDTSKRISK